MPKLTQVQRVILASFFCYYPEDLELEQLFDMLRRDDDLKAVDKTIDIYFVFEDWDVEFLINHVRDLITSVDKAIK